MKIGTPVIVLHETTRNVLHSGVIREQRAEATETDSALYGVEVNGCIYSVWEDDLVAI